MPLRLQLPEAPVAERLQRQDGFAAIKNFTRDIAEYRHPIVRLCGFYVPLEPATAIGCDRHVRLEGDLSALGIDKRTIVAAPRCSNISILNSAERQLGALYVIEGSASGVDLRRGLDGLLGRDETRNACSSLARGTDAAEAWKGYLAQLSASRASQRFERRSLKPQLKRSKSSKNGYLTGVR